MAVQNVNTIKLAKMVAAECSICNIEEQMYVAHSIMNRVSSFEYPDSFIEVISQPNQYTTPVENLKGLEAVYFNMKIYKEIFGNLRNVTYFCLPSTNNVEFLRFVKEGGFKMQYHWFK